MPYVSHPPMPLFMAPLRFSSTIKFVEAPAFNDASEGQKRFDGMQTDIREGFTNGVLGCSSGGVMNTEGLNRHQGQVVRMYE